MEHVIPYCHRLLASFARTDSCCIDFTAGNGNDTLFLAKLCPAGRVYGFDIQPAALETASLLLSENNISNVELILDNHHNFDHYLSGPYDLGVFNLGYLPGSDQIITTLPETTLPAVNKALQFLNKKGLLVIVCYINHPGGREEANLVEALLMNLDDADYIVSKYQFLNKKTAPFVLAAEKRTGCTIPAQPSL